MRNGVDFETQLIIGNAYRDYPALYYNYLVGLAYLSIGLLVLFRRGNAPMSLHFYVLCLTSFIFSSFHYTGKLNNFDKSIYWGNVIAGLLAPTIFLHFCRYIRKCGVGLENGGARSCCTFRQL